ncbi:MAG TPA: glycosyl hydrolase family 18 protein [Polyangiaceae bacterium]
MRTIAAIGALLAFPGLACSSSGAPSIPDSNGDADVQQETSTLPPADAGASGDDGGSTRPPPNSDAGAHPPDGGTVHADAGTDGGLEAGTPAIDYAPYFPTWVWGASGFAYTSLVDLQKKAGLNEVTIAFVLSNGGCNTTQDIEQNASDVQAFIAAGGHVKASFGGADGTYVESQCASASDLATAIEGFVDATGITDLDFDIEQDPVLTDAVNKMRGQALAMVQQSRHVRVAFTLAANPPPGGLTSQGLSVVSNAVSAGVQVWHVNLMTMDYGDSYAGQPLAPVAEGSLTAANAQLVQAIPGLDTASAWRMLGVIPMIGKNDDTEVFSLQDATDLTAFAKQNGLGLVSFWSIDRDQVCPSGADYNSCSTVDTSNFQFDAIFRGVTAP